MITDEQLRQEIARLDWWHSIELRPGIVTPGKSHNLFVEKIMNLPDDLHGKSVLDIGAWDGGYSFECERRGASEVAACDLWQQAGRASFDFARKILDSKVKPLWMSFTDINPDFHGRFDLVLFLGVLYHLKDPLGGLEKVAELTKPGGRVIIDTVIDTTALHDPPSLRFYPSDELNGDPTNWFVVNPAALTAMMAVAGFSRVESVIQLYGGDRTIVHGIKMDDEDFTWLRENPALFSFKPA